MYQSSKGQMCVCVCVIFLGRLGLPRCAGASRVVRLSLRARLCVGECVNFTRSERKDLCVYREKISKTNSPDQQRAGPDQSNTGFCVYVCVDMHKPV